MVNNELKYKANVVRDLIELPEVPCRPSEINQVILNLLVNAAQAIPSDGDADHHEIRVTTRLVAPGKVAVEVSDTGAGIAPGFRVSGVQAEAPASRRRGIHHDS